MQRGVSYEPQLHPEAFVGHSTSESLSEISGDCTEHCYSTNVLNHQQLNMGGGAVAVEVHDCTAQTDIL